MKKSAFPFVLALTLAACGGGGEEYDEPTEAELPDVADIAVPADDASREEKPATDQAAAPNTIPAQYHGVWDYVKGTCNPASDMRMDISANGIDFYESSGDVVSVSADGEDTVVTLDMEGEGETWVNVLRLSLDGEGADAKLKTSDGAKPKVDDEYPRKRCTA